MIALHQRRKINCSEGAFCPWFTEHIPCGKGMWVHHPETFACPKDREEALTNKGLWKIAHPEETREHGFNR